jgi:hypothetical protein
VKEANNAKHLGQDKNGKASVFPYIFFSEGSAVVVVKDNAVKNFLLSSHHGGPLPDLCISQAAPITVRLRSLRMY